MTKPNLDLELLYKFPKCTVAGVDEVGRGCLAGPVLSCAVVLNPKALDSPPDWLFEVTDSKLLSASKREFLAQKLKSWVHAWGIGVGSVEEIDSLNIHHAVFLSMKRAIDALGILVDHVLIDGKHLPKNWNQKMSAHIKGDSKSLSIASASVIAKVFRDDLMKKLDTKHPGYGFKKHKGYGTREHLLAIPKLGVLPIHRRSFAPVKDWV